MPSSHAGLVRLTHLKLSFDPLNPALQELPEFHIPLCKGNTVLELDGS